MQRRHTGRAKSHRRSCRRRDNLKSRLSRRHKGRVNVIPSNHGPKRSIQSQKKGGSPKPHKRRHHSPKRSGQKRHKGMANILLMSHGPN